MSYLDIEGVGAVLPGPFAPTLPSSQPFTRDQQMQAAHAASLERQAEIERARQEQMDFCEQQGWNHPYCQRSRVGAAPELRTTRSASLRTGLRSRIGPGRTPAGRAQTMVTNWTMLQNYLQQHLGWMNGLAAELRRIAAQGLIEPILATRAIQDSTRVAEYANKIINTPFSNRGTALYAVYRLAQLGGIWQNITSMHPNSSPAARLIGGGSGGGTIPYLAGRVLAQESVAGVGAAPRLRSAPPSLRTHPHLPDAPVMKMASGTPPPTWANLRSLSATLMNQGARTFNGEVDHYLNVGMLTQNQAAGLRNAAPILIEGANVILRTPIHRWSSARGTLVRMNETSKRMLAHYPGGLGYSWLVAIRDWTNAMISGVSGIGAEEYAYLCPSE